MSSQTVPGWEGTVGPFPSQYGQPHVYARDVHSGSGNCVCGRYPGHRLHVQDSPEKVPLMPSREMAARGEDLVAEARRTGNEERRFILLGLASTWQVLAAATVHDPTLAGEPGIGRLAVFLQTAYTTLGQEPS